MAPDVHLRDPRRTRVAWSLALAAVMAVALAVRLLPWGQVFTPEGVRFLGDSDPYYHALRARRILAEWPRLPWRDPEMDYPAGADILWPPLFDAVIAATARLVGATAEQPERVAGVAAVVPVLFGLALIPSVALLARRLLGGGAGIPSAFFVALLPACLRFSSVGTADQHVAELLFAVWMIHAFIATWSGEEPDGRWRPALLLAGVTVLAFWNWQGSALALLPLVLFAGLWCVATVEDATPGRAARGLAGGSAVATGVLALTVAAWGPPGAFSRSTLAGVGVTQVAVCAMVAIFAGLLVAVTAWGEPRGRARRAAAVAIAATISVGGPLLIPPIRGGFDHGLTALTAGSPWFQTIDEFRPLFDRTTSPADIAIRSMAAFGGCLLIAPLAAVAQGARWRRIPADRPRIAFLALWFFLFLVLTLVRKRFALYLIVPLALWCESALRLVAKAAARGWTGHAPTVRGAVVGALSLLLVAPALPMVWLGWHVAPEAVQSEALIPLARELQTLRAPPDRPAVMATWTAGHILHYFSGKPVIATPFGTDLGPDGMRDLARFQFASSPEEVEDLLARRRVGFVLVQAPAVEGPAMLGFLPPALRHSSAFMRDDGSTTLLLGPDYVRLVSSRLYHFDGMSPRTQPMPTLGEYRLLAESRGSARDYGYDLAGPPHKLFGVVPGLRLTVRGLLAAEQVFVTARIVSSRGRIFDWTTSAIADGGGHAQVRLPYATGANGLSQAGAYRVFRPGGAGCVLVVEEDQVLLGDRREVDAPGRDSSLRPTSGCATTAWTTAPAASPAGTR